MACRQNTLYLFALILFIISHIRLNSAIQCYTGKRVKPSRQELFQGLADSLNLIQCSNSSKFCYNLILDSTAGNLYQASFACNSKNYCKGKASCKRVTSENKSGTLCCCQTDKCNIDQPSDAQSQLANSSSTPSPTTQPPTDFRHSCVSGNSKFTLMYKRCPSQPRTGNCAYYSNLTIGNDEFGCDLKNKCQEYGVINSCKQVGTSLKVCCCNKDDCNTLSFANVTVPKGAPVHKCISGTQTTEKHADALLPMNCTSESSFCINITSRYSTYNTSVKFGCDTDHICSYSGCYVDITTDPPRNVCCCKNSSCEVDPYMWHHGKVPDKHKSSRIHTLVFISLLTVAAFVAIAIAVVIYKLCKKRKPAYDPVQVTYQRLVMDLSV